MLCILAFGKSEFQVTAGCILRHEVLMEPLVVPFLAGCGILLQAILNCAAEGDIRVDDTVCFGNNLTVDAAWFVVCGGAMALYGFFHEEDFRIGEPFPQGEVRHQYLTGDKVVGGAVAAQSRIVIGGNGICEAYVRFGILSGKGKAFFDDGTNVGEVVCLVKVLVPGDDFCFDVGDEGLGYHTAFLLGCEDMIKEPE